MPHGKPDFSNIEAPVLGHFGTEDDFISVEDAKALEAELQEAGVEAAFEFYEGAGHAFANDHDRLGTYDEGHAKAPGRRPSTSSARGPPLEQERAVVPVVRGRAAPASR